jgi:hypothetical protein
MKCTVFFLLLLVVSSIQSRPILHLHPLYHVHQHVHHAADHVRRFGTMVKLIHWLRSKHTTTTSTSTPATPPPPPPFPRPPSGKRESLDERFTESGASPILPYAGFRSDRRYHNTSLMPNEDSYTPFCSLVLGLDPFAKYYRPSR